MGRVTHISTCRWLEFVALSQGDNTVADMVKMTCLAEGTIRNILGDYTRQGILLHPHPKKWLVSHKGMIHLQRWHDDKLEMAKHATQELMEAKRIVALASLKLERSR